MMRSRRFSKSLARTGLKVIPLIFFLSACTSSTAPSFLKEDIPDAVKNICKKEYKLDIQTKLVGNTLWVYLPLEDIVTKPAKPEKYIERFYVEDKKNYLSDKMLQVNYLVMATPEKEKERDTAIDKSVNEKIINLLRIIHRVLSSTGTAKEAKPSFFCIITADIKNGFELKQLSYVMDLKKFSYGLISQTEYEHRVVWDQSIAKEIIGDRTGTHINYSDITLNEFIANQIQNRIRLKFQNSEVDKNADINKEVQKIVAYTLEIYGFNDFAILEILNQATGERTILNASAVFANSKK